MRSDQIKLGFERALHRGLLRATDVVYASMVTSVNTGAVLADI